MTYVLPNLSNHIRVLSNLKLIYYSKAIKSNIRVISDCVINIITIK